MNPDQRLTGRTDHLKRLPKENYRGQAVVHWSMTMQDRTTGWLVPIFYYKFRELLTHTAFRYGIACPIYCCMPDHLHMLWVGLLPGSDQCLAMRFLRRQLNPILEKLGARLQREAYDHVLREGNNDGSAFEEVFEYIARNPERAGLVQVNRRRDYPYAGCLLPGYPELGVWQEDYWERYQRICRYFREHGMGVVENEPSAEDE
jgi:putative transposase